jgi:multidrug efflux pump subunit AcrA (membrane-fusion protein)
VAPRVDDRTQTVLVKSLLRDAPPAMRDQQFSRARIVWKSAPGLLIPLTAVVRINGKYFCYVAEEKNGGLFAAQRPIDVGELVGNDYVVRSGVKAGERVVVSGIHKIGNGAPIRAQ